MQKRVHVLEVLRQLDIIAEVCAVTFLGVPYLPPVGSPSLTRLALARPAALDDVIQLGTCRVHLVCVLIAALMNREKAFRVRDGLRRTREIVSSVLSNMS
jgi:hypothetical protein